jgi:hypothetical protein
MGGGVPAESRTDKARVVGAQGILKQRNPEVERQAVQHVQGPEDATLLARITNR